MKSSARWAVIVLAWMAFDAGKADAQDSAIARPGFPVDSMRLQSYRRVYDMVVHTRDSAIVIGQREVLLSPGTYAGNPAWLLVETRTGVVPASETLFVSSAMRPLYWFSVQGGARLGATFVGDSLFGAATAPAGRQNLIVRMHGRVIVSQAMAEALVTLLPLAPNWTDSTGVLAIDMAGGSVLPAELSVIGEEQIQLDSLTARAAWVVALRAESRNVFLWVDRETGEVHRVQQVVPGHVGLLLEYRRRRDSAPSTD